MKKMAFLMALFCLSGLAFVYPQNADDALLTRFTPQIARVGKAKIPYRVAVIAPENAVGQPALVVYLHGSKFKGRDNVAQLGGFGVADVLHYFDSVGANVHFLVPQCPKNRRWSEPEDEGREMQALVMRLITDYAAAHSIDTSRIYLVGMSSGGAGVWKLTNDYSDYFAAALLVASYPRYVVDRIVAKTPVCCVVGELDNISTTDEVSRFVGKLKIYGGEVRYDVLQGKDHYATCCEGCTPDRLQWLLEHKRTK